MLSKTSSSELGGNSVSRQKLASMEIGKVNKEAMVQYGKIHARGVVMSDFALSLTWDGDCKTNFVTFCTAVFTLSIQG